MTNIARKSWTRRFAAAVVLTGVLVAGGGALAQPDTTTVQAGDGPPRCC